MKDKNENKKMERWRIVPASVPAVRRNCPKCKEKRKFINSMKFRVNANGKNVDIWLIYRCEKCSTSWNLAIYERSAVHDIPGKEYEGFLSNDRGLAERLGRRADLFARNRVEAVTENGAYQVEIEGDKNLSGTALRCIKFDLPFRMALRLDHLLAEQLGVSRSEMKRWCGEGNVFVMNTNTENMGQGDKLYKGKVKNGLVIGIRKD